MVGFTIIKSGIKIDEVNQGTRLAFPWIISFVTNRSKFVINYRFILLMKSVR